MANFMCATRTNYFRVTDEDRYQILFSNLVSEDNINDFTQEKDGVIFHGFGAYSDINYYDDTDENLDYDISLFLEELQKILPEDEAFIMICAGHERLRYVCADVIVCTAKEVEYLNSDGLALSAARRMLGNEAFITKLNY